MPRAYQAAINAIRVVRFYPPVTGTTAELVYEVGYTTDDGAGGQMFVPFPQAAHGGDITAEWDGTQPSDDQLQLLKDKALLAEGLTPGKDSVFSLF